MRSDSLSPGDALSSRDDNGSNPVFVARGDNTLVFAAAPQQYASGRLYFELQEHEVEGRKVIPGELDAVGLAARTQWLDEGLHPFDCFGDANMKKPAPFRARNRLDLWSSFFVLFCLFIFLVAILATSGCNTFRGVWLDGKGAVRGMRAAYDATTVNEWAPTPADGTRQNPWNPDHLLDHPSYGVK